MFKQIVRSLSTITLPNSSTNYIHPFTLTGLNRLTKLGTHGFVSLVDVMPSLIPEGSTGDYAIVQAARVSYGDGTKKVNDDENLLRYLWRQQHTSPFEMCSVKFHVKTPIFVERQWVRHRTATINEISGRYSILRDEFYRPTRVGYQSTNNKQGTSIESVPTNVSNNYYEMLDMTNDIYKKYLELIEQGVSREVARIALPVSIYTEFYWKANLLNTLKFLRLRMDPHAQFEIREYANAMYEMLKPIFPYTMKAFEDYTLNTVTLSKLEIEALKSGNDSNIKNKREREEFNNKLKKIR